jgi:hypothetical protein
VSSWLQIQRYIEKSVSGLRDTITKEGINYITSNFAFASLPALSRHLGVKM